MTLYDLLLFVHVLAAAAWVGAVLIGALTFEVALRAGDRSWLVRWARYDDRLAPIFYIPAVLLVLTAGVALVLDGPWSFGDGWIVAGLVLLGSAFVLGVGFLIPAGKKLAAAVEGAGAESEDAGERLRSLRPLLWADAAILVAAVFVMTTKPF